MSSKPLVLTGKEFSDEVRSDFTLGNVVPPVGTPLTYTDASNPNVKYAGTNWVKTDSVNKTIGETNYTFANWVRVA
jgi:hypothetical protein